MGTSTNALIQFVVEGQDTVFYLLAFILFLYAARFFWVVSKAIFDNKRAFKLK
jgi:hypothetical protein